MQACHIIAWVFRYCSDDPDTHIRIQERAVAAFRRGGDPADAGDILCTMGTYYREIGNYEQAIKLIQEAVDWYNALPNEQLVGGIYTYQELSTLYHTLSLNQKALEANDRAIERSLVMNSASLDDLYQTRAILYSDLGQTDSSFFYLDAQERYGLARQDIGRVHYARLQRMTEYLNLYPDSTATALRTLTGLAKDTTHISPDMIARTRLELGRALSRSQATAQGVSLMEQSLKAFTEMQRTEDIEYAGRILLDTYSRNGMNDKLAALYPGYKLVLDSLTHENKIRSIAAANVRYETARKEQENRVLTTEIRLKEQVLTHTWITAGILTSLLLFIGLYYRQRQRYHRQVSEARLAQISSLLDTQQKLNQKNELLTGDLRDKALQKVEDEIRSRLNMNIYSPDEDANFRRNFNSLYPNYLPALRTYCPDLTRTDELIAMLLLLGQNNDEIALTLGITKASVNKARSRMRKRLGLVETGVVLEEFLKNLEHGRHE